MNNILVSVIVPVYNAAFTLNRCLDSLLDQGFDLSLQEYEIICVNDGSVDQSLAILSTYQERFPRIIKIINHPENKGLASTRNTGISCSLGRWIAWCDSDDYLIPGALKMIVTKYDIEKYDLFVYSSYTLDQKMMKTWHETNSLEGRVIKEGMGRGLYPGGRYVFLWNCLMRRSFISNNKLTLPLTPITEDTIFLLDFFMCNPRVLETNCKLYRYTVNDNQITRRRDTSFARKSVSAYVTLLVRMNYYRESFSEQSQIQSMTDLMNFQITPLLSRLFSAKLDKEAYDIIRRQLYRLSLFPIARNPKVSFFCTFVFMHYFLYRLSSILFNYFFEPFILPKLSRN